MPNSVLGADGKYYQAGYAVADVATPTTGSIGETTVTVSGNIDITNAQAGGTQYTYVSQNASETDQAIIDNAQDSSVVNATGNVDSAITGLTAGANYYPHRAHQNTSGWKHSESGAQFTTDSEPAGEWPKLAWGDVGHDTGTSLTTTGTFTTSSDGQVVENMRVEGTIFVRTNNVTIRNCHFYRYNQYLIDHDSFSFSASGLTVEDCTFEGGSSAAILSGRGNITLRRCQFRDAGADFLKPFSRGSGSAFLAESCYFGELSRTPSVSHADAFQHRGTSDGIIHTFRGCTFRLPHVNSGRVLPLVPGGLVETNHPDATSTKPSINVFTQPPDGSNYGVLVEYCHINGGNYTLQQGGSVDTLEHIARYNTVNFDYNFGVFTGTWTRYGNRWEESGTPGTSNPASGWEGPFVAGELLPGESAGP